MDSDNGRDSDNEEDIPTNSLKAFYRHCVEESERRFDEYCFPGQCGLCRFSFSHQDEAIAVNNTGETSIVLRLSLFANYEHGGNVSRNSHGHYQTHPERCGKEKSKRAIACHPDCLRLLSSSPRQGVLKALSHSFESPRVERRARRDGLQSKLASRLAGTWPNLPYELRYHIAGYLLSEYAVVLSDAAWKRRGSVSTRLVMNMPIRATSMYFEGIKYVTSLKNVGAEDDAHGEIVYDPKMHQQVDTIYVQENHLGIKQVCFTHLGQEAPIVDKVPGFWWKTLEIPEPDSELEVESDGMKLRCLVKPVDMSANEKIALDEPRRLERTHLRHYPFHHTPESNIWPSRMNCLELNDPDIIGLSVRWSYSWARNGPTAFYAHKATNDTAIYSMPDRSDIMRAGTYFWLYFPIQPGERITELYRRMSAAPHKKGGDEGTALAIITSRGRQFFVGHETATLWQQSVHWNLMELLPQEGTTTVYLDNRPDAGLLAMAFDSPTPSLEAFRRRVDTLPERICVDESGLRDEFFMSTSVSLENVVALIPCYARRPGRPPIIMGIIFQYADGHQDCLGSIRLDRLGDSLVVDSTQNMWLGFGKVVYMNTSFMFSIRFSPPTHAERHDLPYWHPYNPMEWSDVPWTGRLDWWITGRHCQIRHDDHPISPAIGFEESTRNIDK
ncbi:hypothetical protein PT974_01602 [Cladobotryum mycophilum]|uniref:F-box domain-containing protein n=1 Tax=Cladobotryum mycophilum TaxID=491253 RepID=A0ABR0T5I4_9HYPO